jgi:hypothetical protein
MERYAGYIKVVYVDCIARRRAREEPGKYIYDLLNLEKRNVELNGQPASVGWGESCHVFYSLVLLSVLYLVYLVKKRCNILYHLILFWK